MSLEQSMTPNLDKSPQSTGTSFMRNDELNFRASNLRSIEQARAALAAAIYTAPSGSLESVSPAIEQQRLTPPQEVLKWGKILENIRIAYQNDNFDLTRDEIPAINMFSNSASVGQKATAVEKSDELTQDMFGKAA